MFYGFFSVQSRYNFIRNYFFEFIMLWYYITISNKQFERQQLPKLIECHFILATSHQTSEHTSPRNLYNGDLIGTEVFSVTNRSLFFNMPSSSSANFFIADAGNKTGTTISFSPFLFLNGM